MEEMTRSAPPAKQARGASTERQLVLFRLGAELYGADIMTVREIITMQAITALPGMSGDALGVTLLRERLIPVLDLRRSLRLPGAAAIGEETRIVVADISGSPTGFLVDAVTGVLTVTDDQIQPPPEGIGNRAASVRGVTEEHGQLVLVVDLAEAIRQRAAV